MSAGEPDFAGRCATTVYFREGFRRNYEDGYYGRDQYGAFTDGRTSILATVLGTILVFEAIR